LLRLRGLVARELGRWPSEVDQAPAADVFAVADSLIEYPSAKFTARAAEEGEAEAEPMNLDEVRGLGQRFGG
jgi:hypothetical protein